MLNPIPDSEISKLQQDFEDVVVELGHDQHLLQHKQEILAVWYASPFIRRVSMSQPRFLQSLLANNELNKNYGIVEYQHFLSETFVNIESVGQLQRRLRKKRVAAFARIAWRDVKQYTSVQQTLNELSFFAEVCIQGTLQWCFEWLQSQTKSDDFVKKLKQEIVIFALGKLGGGELNFSSDVDIVFAYVDQAENKSEEVQQGHVGQASEFYLRVVQLFIKVLSEQTQDGFVFRVDTRLRPFGDSGSLIPSFSSIDQYFQIHGRDWERYAWQKARVIAGDQQAGEQFLHEITPFIYRRYLDYGAMQSLRKMKALIDTKARQEVAKENLKIGFGGIREIEFIAQMFQLIYGGKDVSLRLHSTLRALEQLEVQGLLSSDWAAKLTKAYLFLRKLENALQLRDDQQIHSLPSDHKQQEHYVYLLGMKNWQEFYAEYEKQTNIVNVIYQSLLKSEESTDAEEIEFGGFSNIWLQMNDKEFCLDVLTKYFEADANKIYQQLHDFQQSSLVKKLIPVARERLDGFVPMFLQQLLQFEEPLQVFNRFLNILKKIVQRSTYVALLVENKNKLASLFKLIDASSWIAQYLATHPLLLDEVLGMDEDYEPPSVTEMQSQLTISLANTDDGLERFMESLREFKHAQMIQIAAADVVESFPIMKVSDHLSWLAEVCISSAVQYAYKELKNKYGNPQCVADSQTYVPEVLIVEYGKLGGLELGYGSDLDVVFLHNSVGESCKTSGENQIHNDVFFTRLVQRTIHILSALTAGGKVFDTDLRLRPHGESGPIICSLAAYENYLMNDAWLWELQALVRARAITGSRALQDNFIETRQKILCQERKVDDVRVSIVDMRNKMLEAKASKSLADFNIKNDTGGLVDIEFIVQFLVLSYAYKHPEICRHTDNIRILDACSQAGLLERENAQELKEIYLRYRKYLHQLSLKLLSEVVDIDLFASERGVVQNYWASLLHSDAG